jgi:hypothetical protein
MIGDQHLVWTGKSGGIEGDLVQEADVKNPGSLIHSGKPILPVRFKTVHAAHLRFDRRLSRSQSKEWRETTI